MLKLDTNINIGDFFNWWGRELIELLPSSFRQSLVQANKFLLALPEADDIVLSLVEDKQVKPLATFKIDAAGKLGFQELFLNQPDLAELDLVLRLPQQDAVSKTIFLPAAAGDNLSQVVLFELDKFTPFKSEQVYFAVKPEIQELATNQIKATLIVTPRNKLDAYVNGLSDWGIVPVTVDYQGVANKISKRHNQYNLLPESHRIKKKRTSEFIIHTLMAVVVMLLLIVAAVPAWMSSQTVDVLSKEIDGVEKDVKTIDGYKIEIDDLYRAAKELIESKSNEPSSLAMLNEISELITDDTWLTHFKYNNGDLQVQGQSPAASLLIGALESSPIFENSHFVSPVTQDKKTGLERFQIAATVVQGGADE